MTQMSTDKKEQDPETYQIIGAAIEVHRQLGHGFLEAVCQDALSVEMNLRHIPFSREAGLKIIYKGSPLTCSYGVDVLCVETVLVELKALDVLTNTERGQILKFLRASGGGRALLLNFGAQRLEYERFVL